MADFAEDVAADENTAVARKCAVDFGEAILRVDVGGLIDRAAQIGRNERVAIGGDEAATGERGPWPLLRGCECAVVEGALRAAAGEDLDFGGLWARGNHADNPADGAGAVEIGCAAAHNLDGMDRELRQFFPVDPTAV